MVTDNNVSVFNGVRNDHRAERIVHRRAAPGRPAGTDVIRTKATFAGRSCTGSVTRLALAGQAGPGEHSPGPAAAARRPAARRSFATSATPSTGSTRCSARWRRQRMGRGDPVPALAAAAGDRSAGGAHPAVPARLGTNPRRRRRSCPRRCSNPPAPAGCARRWTCGRTRTTGGSRPTSHAAIRRRPITSSGSGPPRRRCSPRPCAAALGSALDVGTGCGIQALHLLAARPPRHGDGCAPAGRSRWPGCPSRSAGSPPDAVELLCGDLLAPVAGRQFDLVVSNPPFVLAPSDGDALTYRDAAGGDDGGLARLLREAAGVLAPDGVAQVLTSWVVGAERRLAGSRPAAMLPAGCDALVLLREVLDPAEHVALWRDEDEPEPRRDGRSLRWLAHVAGARGRGHRVRAGGAAAHRRRAPRAAAGSARRDRRRPTGARIAGWLDRSAAAIATRQALASCDLWSPPDVRLVEESVPRRGRLGGPVAGGSSPQRAAARRSAVDPMTAALLAGCDGQLAHRRPSPSCWRVASGRRPVEGVLRVAAAASCRDRSPGRRRAPA